MFKNLHLEYVSRTCNIIMGIGWIYKCKFSYFFNLSILLVKGIEVKLDILLSGECWLLGPELLEYYCIYLHTAMLDLPWRLSHLCRRIQ